MAKQIFPDAPSPSVRKIKRIPIDRERVKSTGEFFGRTFTNQTPVKRNGNFVYTIKKQGFTLDYRFDSKKTEELKFVLRLNKEKGIYSLGRRAVRLWYSLIVLAAEQGKGNIGTFRLTDIVRLWAVERSGKLYTDIKQTFLSLATFNPHFSNNQTDKKRVEWGHSFFDAWLIKGEGDSAVFEFELNKIALGITHEWLINDLSISELDQGYLSFKVSELKKPRPDPKYENFLERLRLLKPGVRELKVKTILNDWIKANDDFLRRRLACHDLVIKYLKQAQLERELKDFRVNFQAVKNWQDAWTVVITKNGKGS